MHARREEVDADQRQVAARVAGLLLQAYDAPFGTEFGDAEGAGVGDLGEQDAGVGAGLPELVDEFGDAADHEVVAEVHHEVVVAEPVAGDQDGVRQAEGLFLGEVGDAGAEARAVAHGRTDLLGGVADDDADVGDAHRDQGFDAVEEHRLVGDGDELLGGGVGDGPQPAAGASGEDKCLHERVILG